MKNPWSRKLGEVWVPTRPSDSEVASALNEAGRIGFETGLRYAASIAKRLSDISSNDGYEGCERKGAHDVALAIRAELAKVRR